MQERIIFSLTITVSKSPSQVQYLSLYSWPRQTLKVQFTRLIRSARQIRLVIHQSFLSSSASKVCCKGRLIRITWGASSTHIYALLLLAKYSLEKEMAAHSSVLAWRTPGTEEPGGLPSMGSHRVGHG